MLPIKARILNMTCVINSLTMKLLVLTSVLCLTQAFPTEKKLLDIDQMPCHPEALEVGRKMFIESTTPFILFLLFLESSQLHL